MINLQNTLNIDLNNSPGHNYGPVGGFSGFSQREFSKVKQRPFHSF